MDGMSEELDCAFFYVVCVLLLIGMLASCATKPTEFDCKGKGSITWAGVGGATLQADCGDGFSYKAK